VCDIHSDVELLSGLGPAYLEQVCGRNNLIEGVVVDRTWRPLKLRVGSIHSLMDTKFIQVGPVSRIQLSTAVVLWIGVVIRDSFAAQVAVSAQYPSGYFLRTALTAAVVIRQAGFLSATIPFATTTGTLFAGYATGTDIEDRRRAEERMRDENLALREQIDQAFMFEEIVGAPPALQSVLSSIVKVAPPIPRCSSPAKPAPEKN
jgi:hypothetical protein